MEGNEAQELVAGLGGFLVKDPRPGKDACVQLVLDTGGDKLNILEYLKTEMLEDKRGDKDGVAGSIVSLFDHNISLNFEVMEDGTARAVPDTEADVTGAQLAAPVPGPARRARREREGGRIARPKNYVCGDCNTAFVSTKDLARHSVVHTGEKVRYHDGSEDAFNPFPPSRTARTVTRSSLRPPPGPRTSGPYTRSHRWGEAGPGGLQALFAGVPLPRV